MKTLLSIDPDLSTLLPDIEIDELRQLRENLERDGCTDPILHWRGMIVDGHNRYALCEELGIPYQTRELDFPDIDAAKLWMIERQMGRRNWTQSQASIAWAMHEKIASQQQHSAAEQSVPLDSQLHSNKGDASKFRAIRGSGNKGKSEESLGFSQKDPAIRNLGVQNTEQNRKSAHEIPQINEAISEPDLKAARKVVAKGSDELINATLAGKVNVREAAKIAERRKSQQRIVTRKPKPAADESPKDELGQPIPENLLEAFAARGAIDECLNHLTAISKLMNPLIGNPRDNIGAGPGGEFLADHRQRLVDHLRDARSHISFGRPYAVCPSTHHKGPKCPHCRGTGYMTKEIYSRAGVKNAAA